MSNITIVRDQPGLVTKGAHSLLLNGRPVFSITKALSIIDKPPLRKWGIDMAIDSLRATWEPDRAYPMATRDALLQGAAGASEGARRGAADSGSKVATWVELYIRGQISGTGVVPPRPDDDAAAIATIESFLDWELNHRVKWLATEWKMADPTTLVGGRMDCFGIVDGKPTAVDCKRLKTPRLYPEHELQLSGYAHVAAAAGLIPGIKAGDIQRILLALPAVGGEAVPFLIESDVEDDWNALMAAARLRQRIPEYGKGG